MNIPTLPEYCKPIPDFPGYCAHPDGYILSCYKNKWGYADNWHQLKSGSNNKYRRQCVVLVDKNGKHSKHVHRLILLAFVGKCPPGMESCHNNGNAGDNHLDNLRWDTRAANMQDFRRHGMKKGERHPLAKLTDDIVREIRKRATTGETHQSIADTLGIKRRNVSSVVDRSTWGHVI